MGCWWIFGFRLISSRQTQILGLAAPLHLSSAFAEVPSAALRCPQHLPSDSHWSSQRPHTERSCAAHPWCCTGRPPVLDGWAYPFGGHPKYGFKMFFKNLNKEVLRTTKQFSCKVDMDEESSLVGFPSWRLHVYMFFFFSKALLGALFQESHDRPVCLFLLKKPTNTINNATHSKKHAWSNKWSTKKIPKEEQFHRIDCYHWHYHWRLVPTPSPSASMGSPNPVPVPWVSM